MTHIDWEGDANSRALLQNAMDESDDDNERPYVMLAVKLKAGRVSAFAHFILHIIN